MKKILLSAFFAANVGFSGVAFAAAIEQVIVRQQWPWSTDIKVECKLSGVTTPVDIGIRAYNGDAELTLPASAVSGERYGITKDGICQFTIDPIAAFGTEQIALANFKVKLSLSDSAADIGEILYVIFDLTKDSDSGTSVTRADLMNGKYGAYETSGSTLIWTGVASSDKYRSTHLVMRKIPAAAAGVWLMGSPTDDPDYKTYGGRELQHQVQLTSDYYMGVFPITQGQFTNILRTAYTHFSFGDYQDSYKRPASNVLFSEMRGSDQDVESITATGCILYKLNSRTGRSFDLPTDAQWEFACRAGTTTAIYSGKAYSVEEMCLLGWTESNSSVDDVMQTHEVGLKLANGYGLYDMCGNVREIMLDHYSDGATYATYVASASPMVNPTGITSTSETRVYRGGGYDFDGKQARSAFRYSYYTTGNRKPDVGFRLVMKEISE